MKKRVLIIGANSILSIAIVKRLLEIGKDEIIQVIHRNSDKLLYKGNIVFMEDLFSLKNNFDVVYFISSFITKEETFDSNNKIIDTNILLLNKISYHFSKAKLIHSSSVSIYEVTQKVINEQSEVNPVNMYAISKLAGERIVLNHKGGGVNIRLSSLFGEKMNTVTFLPLIIKKAIEDKQIVLLGTGERLQNYVSADEASEYFVRAIDYQEKDVLLAVNYKSFSNKEVAHIIKNEIEGCEVLFEGNDNSPNFIYDNIRSKEKLGIKELVENEPKFINYIQWMIKNQS